MASRQQVGGVLQDVQTLFDSGTIVGLTDGELLGRLSARPEGYGDDWAELAFAALVERHGPMVLRVCLSILGDEHDAQDAFQATFLVLVCRARIVRRRESVGSWLYGVALRVATRARADLARRRRHERHAGAARAAADRSGSGAITPEATAILHEELGRLPEHYRDAVVLCYLEGQTCEAAARQLGWPVGTVKSRLSRGRERLRGQLARRGLAPDETNAPILLLPATLVRTTAKAMLQFVRGTPAATGISATALSLTHWIVRSLQMKRLALISTLLIVGFAATGAAMWTVQGTASVTARTTVTAAPRQELAGPAPPERKTETVTVRVIDPGGRVRPDVQVEVLEHFADHDGPRYRTGADGQARIPIDPYADPGSGTRFLARPDDRTIGWAYLPGPEQRKDREGDPIPLVLLARNHMVDGSVTDRAGRPISGARIRAISAEHETNRGFGDFAYNPSESVLGSAITDQAGRYTLILPERAKVRLVALHPRYVGPAIECGPDERTIPPLAMEGSGGIAGTVVDGSTGRPVAGARLHANRIEFDDRRLLGAGSATTDARGHFRIDGLAPGVYNLCLYGSPRGRRFTGQAIEGVRVEAGADAPAELTLIEGRRIQGTVVDVETGEPISRVAIYCSSTALPTSGHRGEAAYTDEQGRFEFFVPPGPARIVFQGDTPFAVDRKTLVVSADRDPEPVRLQRRDDPGDPRLRSVNAPGRPGQLRFELAAKEEAEEGRPRVLSGRVLDEDGQPIAGAQINYNREGDGRVLTYATDRRGVFRVEGLPPDKWRMRAFKEGYGGASAGVPLEAVGVEIILPRQPLRPD